MITKNPYDPSQVEQIEMIFETYIVSSSLSSDMAVLLKSFKETQLSEYEDLVQHAFTRLESQVRLILEARGLDAIYNAEYTVVPLFSGAILVSFTGDGCRHK
ncbi:MAG TPA: hypothetical protein GXZ74_06075 [Tissierellia bacterium]|nr:hypothetical protein [Tissierellia bacterium]